MDPPPITATIGLVSGCILAVILIFKHRKAARVRSKTCRSSDRSSGYTSNQQLEIFGILFFLLPVSLVVSSTLAKGIIILGGFVLALLPPITIVQSPAMAAVAAGGGFITFYFPYYLCALVWPRRPGQPIPVDHDGA